VEGEWWRGLAARPECLSPVGAPVKSRGSGRVRVRESTRRPRTGRGHQRAERLSARAPRTSFRRTE